VVVRPQEDKFKETAENPTTGSLVHFNAMTAAAFTRFSDDASRRGAFVERAVADQSAKAIELKSLNSEHRDRTLPTADIYRLACAHRLGQSVGRNSRPWETAGGGFAFRDSRLPKKSIS
jgi:hypothetical protein